MRLGVCMMIVCVGEVGFLFLVVVVSIWDASNASGWKDMVCSRSSVRSNSSNSVDGSRLRLVRDLRRSR